MAPGGILHTVLCGRPDSEIAKLIQAIRPGKTARKRKALLLEEVGALCQEPAAHRRLSDLVFAKYSAEYLRLVLRSSGGVRGARLNRKQCIDELVRLDGGSGASSSAESRTASSAPHLHRHFDPSILAGPATMETSAEPISYVKTWNTTYKDFQMVSLKWDIKAGKVEEIWEVRKVPKPRKSLTAMKGTKRFKVLSKLKKYIKPNKSSASSSGK